MSAGKLLIPLKFVFFHLFITEILHLKHKSRLKRTTHSSKMRDKHTVRNAPDSILWKRKVRHGGGRLVREACNDTVWRANESQQIWHEGTTPDLY